MVTRFTLFAVVAMCVATGLAGAAPWLDAATQGDWLGVYGSQGYILPSFLGGGTPANDVVALPGYVASHTLSGSRWMWTGSTGDARAVVNPADPANRRAACAYDGGSFGLSLSLTKPMAFVTGLYLLDWDSFVREQRVSVSGHAPVDASGFHDGVWYRYAVKGSAAQPVTAQFARLAGANAVVSAITFDPLLYVYQLVGTDDATRGDWLDAGGNRLYGTDGYILPAFDGTGASNASDRVELPEFVQGYSFSTPGGGRWRWAVGTGDARALLDPADPGNASARRATCAFASSLLGFQLDVERPVEFDVGLYLLDWDSTVRAETLMLPSALGVPDEPASGFNAGRWYVYHVYADPDHPLTLDFARTAGANAVVSAITLDNAVFVPEPTALSLVGLGALALLRRRRR